jgi:hypothetical protein
VSDGEVAWAVMQGQPMQLSDEQIENMRAGALANPIQLLRALADPQADLRYVGRVPFGSKEAEAVEWVRTEGRSARVYFDPAGGELLALEQPELAPSGSGWTPVQRGYGDYRTVGKLRYPHRIIVYSDGVKTVETRISEVELNPTFAPDLFRRPAP